jgi:DNA-binding beta-propeller fold protein YncE
MMLKGNNTDITIQRININTPASPNTDGMDLASSNVLVQNCYISDGDDNIEIGGGGDFVATSVVVTNCTFGIGHGVSIGSKCSGGVSNLTVVHCTFNNTDYGIRMKADNDSGGIVQNLSYCDLGMTNITYAPIVIYSYYHKYGTPTTAKITPAVAAATNAATISSTTPIWRNIVISNLTATAAQPGMIWARTEMPATNIMLNKLNITASGSYQNFEIYNAKQIQIVDSQFHLSASANTNFWLFDADVTFSNSTASTSPVSLYGLTTNSYVNNLAFYNSLATLSATNTLGAGPLTMADSLLIISNNFTLYPTTVLNYTLDPNTNRVAVAGNLALGGIINVTNGPGFGIGTNTLLTYTGTLSGSSTLGSTPGSPFTCTLDTSVAGQVNLVVVNTNDFLGTTALLEGPAAGSDSVVLAAIGPWTAKANAAWLHVSVANQSGTGSTNVVFSYDANPGATRSGTLTIAGQTLTVTQAGSTYVAAPGPVTTLVASGLNYPNGVAVDGTGNVYITDSGNNALKKWTAANNTVTTLVSSGLSFPAGVAVDGAGNVYIADYHNTALKKWTAASNTVTTLVASGLFGPSGVAVDGAGNVFIADTDDWALKKWTAANNTVATLVASGLQWPDGVAVDGAGNVYITDIGNTIKKWTAANNTVTTLVSSGLSGPSGVAVDGAGNVYIADGNTIKKWTAARNTVTPLVASGLWNPYGVAVDGAGNVYIADYFNNAIKELPRAFVDPTARLEGPAAGSDVLPVVLPATENLLAPFAPTSDQPWLTISGINNGVVGFAFTANPGSSGRTAHITLLGQPISITQAAAVVTPPTLFGLTTPGNGTFRFAFSNNQGVTFTVLTTTNLLLPMTGWTVAGAPANIAPGLFQFSTAITNGMPRFYRVRSP